MLGVVHAASEVIAHTPPAWQQAPKYGVQSPGTHVTPGSAKNTFSGTGQPALVVSVQFPGGEQQTPPKAIEQGEGSQLVAPAANMLGAVHSEANCTKVHDKSGAQHAPKPTARHNCGLHTPPGTNAAPAGHWVGESTGAQPAKDAQHAPG